MKKFIVSILGIFLLFGAGLLSACGKTNPSMTLSQNEVAIQLYSDDEDSGYKIISAQLSGVKDGSISASAASGYENIIDVSTTRLSATKFSIRVEGLEEGNAEIIVRGAPGNIVKSIYVNVFSEVSAMTQKEEQQVRKENFLIRGIENEIVETKLISFQPSDKSRRSITWSLSNDMLDVKGLELNNENNTLKIENDFAGDEVKLVATTEKGITTTIVLPVIDKIEDKISLAFSYSQNQNFAEINETNNQFNIVPNIPGEGYQGYIAVDYNGQLDISPYVTTLDGKPSDDIQVLRHGTIDNKPLFIVYASKDKSNINKDYLIGFQIGYTNYNYFVDSMESNPITIKAREKVNGIILSTNEVTDAGNTIQTLYTTYVDGEGTSINGQRFNVLVTPTTVIDASNKYSINISRTSAEGGNVADGCPVEVWYRDEKNGNVWTQAILEENPENGDFFTSDMNMLSAKTIFLKASSSLKEQIVTGYSITFTSQDNKDVSTSFSLRLVKSASLNDFGFNNANFRVDSSINQAIYSRQFTLKGQTSIDGLSISNSGKYVDFKKITEISHDEESVTFEVSFALLPSSYGVTAVDTYKIVHSNGLASNNYDIDIFLPLKDASMFVDIVDDETGEYSSNSVIDSDLSNKVFDVNGNLLDGRFNSSLSKLIVKNNKTTPISYNFNSVNGISAVANISVGFFDFNSNQMALDEFKKLIESEEGVVRVVRSALDNLNSSNIAFFSADNKSIITKGVGSTYAVVAFTGKGVENADENGNVTFIRVIYIESLVVPEGLNVYPEADKNITLFANDTVADEDKDLTLKTINITFKTSGITHENKSNIEFVSNKMGRQIGTSEDGSITWQNGRYSVEQISVNSEGISFNIASISTFDSHIFTDTLFVHYVIYDDNGEKLYDISSYINITIKNAQRIESLKLKNYDPDGLYFEINDSSSQYLLLESNPTNSKNKKITTILTDDKNVLNTFVNINDSISADTIAVNLESKIKDGMNGFIYLLPSDAIYGEQVKYYYRDENESEQTGYVAKNNIPAMYDFLIEKAYFKSNVSLDETKEVRFADILIKLKVTVADGKSFDFAYRIYDNHSFKAMRDDRYYTVMNNLDLSGEERKSIANFKGGLQGINSNVTIKLEGNNFATVVDTNAIIQNITFIGNVSGEGFVCNENRGNIIGVTVDVNGRSASSLISSGNAGGIAGTNNGKIALSNVFGLSIIGENYVGGIAGINNELIERTKVEFYNLETKVDGNNVVYGANTFVGQYVGGIAGQLAGKSIIKDSYAYDYTIDKKVDGTKINVLQSNIEKAGAFAGNVAISNYQISNSFSVVNEPNICPGFILDIGNSLNNVYISYYDGENYTSTTFGLKDGFVKEGEEGFKNYVNKGKPHLKDLMQEEIVGSVAHDISTHKENGFYKSLSVDQNNGILFNYAVEDEITELSTSEEKDLIALNTISLNQLVGKDADSFNKNIIVSSSDTSIVKVIGKDLRILKTGEVVITLSSKHDVSLTKQINAKVTYALSDLVITWVDSANRTEIVSDNSISSLQKTRSRAYITTFDKSQIYIGSLAKAYQLKEEDKLVYDIITSSNNTLGEGEELVMVEDNLKSGFKISASNNSVLTNFKIAPKVFDEELYHNAIKRSFTRNFSVLPIDGVISFEISNDKLPITPSTNASQRVKIKTTDESDSVYPVISYDGQRLISKNLEDETNILLYTIYGEDKAILKATINKLGIDENAIEDNSNLKTYIYDIIFEVNDEYRALVSHEMDFEVFFMSRSGNSSEEWNGVFTLSLTSQKFNNIDISNKKIKASSYKYIEESIVEVHEVENETSVLAPGNSSILQINVNPEYAYYDYVELSYTDATVSEAVNIEVMQKFQDSNILFKRRSFSGNEIEKLGPILRYYPSAEEKGTLYYKLWINTTVNSDVTLKFTARFFDKDGKQIHFVNYFLSISYLAEPTITIDGSNTAFLAKGATSQVKIEVFADQSIDNLTLDGKNVSGVSLSALSKGELDEVRGIKTYTASLYAEPNAKADSDVIYISAQVSRELNGSKEIKSVVSTGILVDFKVDGNNIKINGSSDNNITIWQGVPKTIDINYNIIPEEYGNAASPEIEEAISDLRKKRNEFIASQYYPVKKNESGEGFSAIDDQSLLSQHKYFINYKYDEKGLLHAQNLEDRLFVVIGSQRFSINDSSIEIPFKINYDELTNSISFTGTKIDTSVVLALKTYISAGGATQEFETIFTVNIDAYSDPDLPLLIKNATDFEKLDPAKAGESATAHDYILTNDIILEDYSPFDTSLIESFDGNGHTIYIKSFDLNYKDSSSLNIALFKNVTENTILKNVRVNLYNGGQLKIDTSKFTDINIAGLAITNDGIITNCEVVAFYTDREAIGKVDNLYYSATDKHNYKEGINVKFTYGANDQDIYMHDNDRWSSQIAGLVISNNGSITNSRVGGDSIVIIGDERLVSGNPTGETYATNQKLGLFNIVGQGNIAGFALNNTNGNIASSYVKNVDLENQSDSTMFYTSGFVGLNTSTINVSYVEGKPSDPQINEYTPFAYEGSSIKSKKGYVVGFVYRNEGRINDSYSNILIANTNSETSVYLASGFVYENVGTIENAYSASQIENSMNTQMNFSGVNAKGELLAEGEYINCYFFNKEYEDTEESSDNTTETQNNTGAVLIPTPDKESLFYGFAIANGENDGIWKIVKDEGIFLISTNLVSVSHRYILYIDKDEFEGVTGEDEQGAYILPYSTLNFTDTGLKVDTSLGGANNPIIITDADDFVSVSGTSTSSYISEYFNSSAMWGTYRIVDDINLSDIANGDNVTVLPSSSKAFAGTLYGNGFTISGLSLATEESGVALGLFRSIEKRGKEGQPVVKNLNISLIQVDGSVVTMAGALAGYIKDSVVVSIDINFENNAFLTGYNFAGGLAGFVIGDNTIKGIKVFNPNVTARTYLSDNTKDDNFFISDEVNKASGSLQALRVDVGNNLNYNTSYSSSLISNLKNYSYAGGVIGFVDNYRVNLPSFDINQAENFNIKNVRVNGTVYIEGQVVGGVFGLAGYQTIIRDVGITIDGKSNSHIIATKYFAGGVIGQAFGSLNRIFAVHDQETQDNIENNIAKFYQGDNSAPRGILDLFNLEGKNYTQRYIGGLVGVAYSGSMVISYSKLNATSPTADYAGGIVGGLKLQDTSPYQINVYENTDYYTKYYMNEVYAIGDVRARNVTADHENDLTYAGGIVGQIYGEASRVVMMSVNAFNFITTYNYQTKTYNSEPIKSTNISQIYRINSLVGHFVKLNKDNEKVVDNVVERDADGEIKIGNYNSYIILVKFYDTSGEQIEEKYIPSIGVYDSYYRNVNGKPVSLNLFGKSELFDAREVFEKEGLGEEFYFIESPRSYETSAIGHQYTSTGFLNSDVWNIANWEHDTNKLFPTIKYKRSSDILYLDQYNVEEIFRKMQGSNATVYLRGRESKGSEVYGDIDLRKELYNLGKDIKINSFAGKLVGGKYFNPDKSPVKIISDRNFISSVATGFKVEDVEIIYDAGQSKTEIEVSTESNAGMGLFISGQMEGAEIDKLTLTINSPVVFKVSPAKNKVDNIGLVAANILDSEISKLKIQSGITNPTSALMQINSTDNEKNNDTLYAGLIAGKVELSDTALSSRNIKIEDIEFSCDIMSVNMTYENYCVGTYFGIAQRRIPSLNLNIYLGSIKKANIISGAEKLSNPQIYIKGNQEAKIISVGGYIGRIATESSNDNPSILPISSILVNGEEPISTAINIKIGDSTNPSIETLNIGGIFGENYGSNDLSFNASNCTMDVSLFANAKFKTISAGGLVGFQKGKLSVTGYSQIDFGAICQNDNEANTKFKTNKDSFDSGKYLKNNEKEIKSIVATNAYIGGVVGYSNAQLNIESNNLIINPIDNDSKVNRISVNASEKSYLGSVVGYSENSNLTIKARIKTNTEFVADNSSSEVQSNSKNSESSYIIGGIVGFIANGKDNNQSNQITQQIGAEGNNLIRFDGAVYSKVNNLLFGGIVGKVSFANENDKLEIQNSSFGGVAKIFDINKNMKVTTGGSIGSIDSIGSIGSVGGRLVNLTLTNSYNYGDIFVEYKDENKLNAYTFGGLLGEIATNVGYNINSNYSIATSHNAKNSTTTYNVNALFGQGIVKEETKGIVKEETSNYYNHAVALANDQFGIDMAYKSQSGFAGYENSTKEDNILNVIAKKINDQSISKLYPGTVNEDGSLKIYSYNINGTSYDSKPLNGMRYFALGSNYSVQIKDGEKTDLKNVAIIGDAQNIKYSNSNSQYSAMFKSISGYSYISGIALEVDVAYEDNNNLLNVAPLVEEMYENSIVYAVNVRGTFDVGGNIARNVSGIVGTLYSGKIFDSSTDLDITYRAGIKKNENNNVTYGNVYGFANAKDGSSQAIGKLIENTFTSGSIKTLISANVYAFTNAIDKTEINNSYTITKLDLHDYTRSDDINQGIKGIFGANGTTKNCYADYDALNFTNSIIGNDKATAINHSTFKDKFTDIWTSDYNFNYGYPTLKYQYLKNSSYAILSASQSKLQRLQEEKRAYNKKDENKYSGNDSILYDNYVIENEYTRLANGVTPEDDKQAQEKISINNKEVVKSYYFMIPNLGVLANINNIICETDTNGNSIGNGLTKNFILRYDIDVNNIVKEHTEYPITTNEYPITTNNLLSAFTGVFDGQGKTIKGLTMPLFESIVGDRDVNSITKGIVRNLRLTEANLGNSLLANSITNALISSMTISGDLKLENRGQFIGGLANTVEGSEINTLTNMLNIDISAGKDTVAGGLVGQLTNSNILFSSNYGPINARVTDGKTLTLGGLVGEVSGKSQINYSYNATSVLGNYATNSQVQTTKGTFITGGLVGKLNEGEGDNVGIISNSYNSGMVKSGNKSNDNKSYAGGIVGYIKGGSVTNCYNEGTVEALATNPKTEWRGIPSSYNFGTTSGGKITIGGQEVLKLVQTSARNVYAYGIGYNGATEVAIQNSTLRLVNNKDETTIISNGSALDSGTEIYKISWNDIFTSEQLKNHYYDWEKGLYTNHTYTGYAGSIVMIEKFDFYKTLTGISINATSLDWLGVPRSYVITFESDYRSDVFRSYPDLWRNKGTLASLATRVQAYIDKNMIEYGNGVSHTYVNSVNTKGEVSWKKPENYRTNATDSYNGDKDYGLNTWASIPSQRLTYAGLTSKDVGNDKLDTFFGGHIQTSYDKQIYESDADKISNKYDKEACSVLYKNEEAIKKACRSQEVDATNLDDMVKINGVIYRYASSNNMKSIFEQGIVKESTTIETELPYNSNLGCYQIETTNPNIGAIITDVENNNGNAILTIEYYTTSENVKNGDISTYFNITFNYYQEITLDLSNIKYFYKDDYSVGIEIARLNYDIMQGYSLTYGENNVVGNVIRISKTKYDTFDEPLKNDHENFLYLFCDTDENGRIIKDRYVFAPNAKLKTPLSPDNLALEVNKSETNLTGGENFADDVKNVIGEISQNTYYSRFIKSNEYYQCFEKGFNSDGDYENFDISINADSSGQIYEEKENIIVSGTGANISLIINGRSGKYVKITYKNTDGQSVEKSFLVTGTTMTNIDNLTLNNPSLHFEFFATYKSQSISINESFDYNLVLQDEDGVIYYINAVVNPTGEFNEDKTISSTTDINFVYRKFGNGENAKWISVECSEEDFEEGAEENRKEGIYKNYDYFVDDNFSVLRKREKYYYQDGALEYDSSQYIVYYDEKGLMIESNEEDGEGKILDYTGKEIGDEVLNEVYFPVYGILGQIIKGSALIEIVKDVKNLPNLEKFKDMFTIYNYDVNGQEYQHYLFINKPYSVLNNDTFILDEGTDDESILWDYKTMVNVDTIEFSEFKMPEYQTTSFELVYPNMTFPVDSEIQGEDFLNDLCKFTISDNKNYEIYLKNNLDGREGFVAQYNTTYTSDAFTIEQTESETMSHVILNRDISMLSSGLIKHGDLNIIGNGYYLSYFDSGLFKIQNGEKGAYVNNINFLGEVYGTSILLASLKNDTISQTFENVSVYGSVVNSYSFNNTLQYIIISNEVTLTNFNIYASVNSISNRMSYKSSLEQTISLLAGNYDQACFKGVIVLANGIDATTNNNKDIKSGQGGHGISIKVSSKKDAAGREDFNQGILIASKGGNALAQSYTGIFKGYKKDEPKLVSKGENGEVIGMKGIIIGNSYDAGKDFNQIPSLLSIVSEKSEGYGGNAIYVKDNLNSKNGKKMLTIGGEDFYYIYGYGDKSIFNYRYNGAGVAYSHYGFRIDQPDGKGANIRAVLGVYYKNLGSPIRPTFI